MESNIREVTKQLKKCINDMTNSIENVSTCGKMIVDMLYKIYRENYNNRYLSENYKCSHFKIKQENNTVSFNINLEDADTTLYIHLEVKNKEITYINTVIQKNNSTQEINDPLVNKFIRYFYDTYVSVN